MNISTGGPHILFFERDQQMATLLGSEFQLAGYECHTARTAVEVFDAIARYSVRILLVNLAQAAAGRREFWVALETQRRGRGVQVFTYQCKNIASYGPAISSDDAEERPYAMKPEIEVDGMLGVVNLLEAVKRGTGTRSSGLSSSTNTNPNPNTGGVPRLTATPVVNGKTMQAQNTTLPPMPTTPAARDIFPLAERTAPLQAVNPQSVPSGVQRPASFSQPTTMPVSTASTAQAETQTQTPTQPQGTGSEAPQAPPVSSVSEKIRAVIYPGQQSWSRNGAERQESVLLDSEPKGQTASVESGLAQLSRMLEEQKGSASAPLPPYMPPAPQAAPTLPLQEPAAPWQILPPTDTVAPPSTSSLPLRAAPIQDIPPEHDDYSNGTRRASFEGRGQGEATRPENAAFSGATQAPPATPLSVLASMMGNAAPPAPVSPTPPIFEREAPPADTTLETTISNGNGNGRADEYKADEAIQLSRIGTREESVNGQESSPRLQAQASSTQIIPPATSQATPVAPAVANNQGQVAQQTTQQATTAPAVEAVATGADPTLLDIMQSLPPMPSPAPQQSSVQASVLTGRATRALGSVLLEGHLVPQDRLEVAQNIQRMLRGVDMNYQLGEILLMFKLLTPDQLLAASLVSYGLLTTAQIRALGRIRQELHSIGLEYDLENLLILFRILSPEQLREVRASWNS